MTNLAAPAEHLDKIYGYLTALEPLTGVDAGEMFSMFMARLRYLRAEHRGCAFVDHVEDTSRALRRLLDVILGHLAGAPVVSSCLNPYLSTLTAVCEWCNEVAIPPAPQCRVFSRGYMQCLLLHGEVVANEHAERIAFDYASRTYFGSAARPIASAHGDLP